MVYSWIKEMGLSNLHRSSLCSGTILAFRGEKDTVDVFLHKLLTVTLSSLRKALLSL